jgi:hypothetical protein
MCPPQPFLSGTANATVNDSFYTTGPLRSGDIEISVNIFSLTSNPLASDTVTDGIHTYTGCPPGSTITQESCNGSATLPFELGTTFQVSALAPGATDLQLATNGSVIAVEDGVNVTFGLFDANGAPVPFFAAPEPATYGLLLSGIALFPILRRRRSGLKRTK